MSRTHVLGALEHYQVLQLNRVVGLLARLRTEGLVASFEPRLEANGILVTTIGPAGSAALGAAPVLLETTEATEDALERSAQAFDAAVLAQMKSVRTEGGESTTFWTHVRMGNTRISGTVSPNWVVKVVLKDPSGAVLSRTRAVADGSGDWLARFRNWRYPYRGCKVIVRAGGIKKSTIIPRLTITADRSTDLSSGNAPKSVAVNVGFEHRRLGRKGWSGSWYDHWVATSATGQYSYDFTSDANMIGMDWTSVGYGPDAHWWIERGISVPHVVAGLATNGAWGTFDPVTDVTVVLKDSAGVEKARTVVRSDYSGWFYADFWDASGDPVLVRTGDKVKVSGSGSFSAKAINLTATANAADDTVSGTSNADRALEVGLYQWTSYYGYDSYWEYGKADSAGHYLVDFTSQVDMAPNDSGYVYFRNRNSGDGTEMWFIAE